jgi:hypothetical protein
MAEVPVTLEAVDVKTYSELYGLSTAEVIKRLDEKKKKGRDVPLHEGDAFLAVLVLRGVADLAEASKRLETATDRLVWLTRALLAATVIALVIAVLSSS